jgi:hypothetical protein
MPINNIDELLGDLEPIEEVHMDIDKIKSMLPSYTNEKLCEMIVCDRYFGFGQRIDIMCMEELANRRIAGDTFDFESYIEQQYKELPVLDLKTPDLREVLTQAMTAIGRVKPK